MKTEKEIMDRYAKYPSDDLRWVLDFHERTEEEECFKSRKPRFSYEVIQKEEVHAAADTEIGSEGNS